MSLSSSYPLFTWLSGSGYEVNLLQVCSSKSTKAKTPKAKTQAKAYNPFDDNEVPTPVSVDELMARKPGKGDNPFVESDVAEDSNPANEHEPKLDLPQLQTGVGNCSHGAHHVQVLHIACSSGACI